MKFAKTANLILSLMMGTLSSAYAQNAQNHDEAVTKCLAYERANPTNSAKEIKKGYRFTDTNPKCEETSKTCKAYQKCLANLYYSLGAIYNNRRNNPDCKEAFEDTKFMKRATETTIDCTDQDGKIHLGG